MIQQIDTAYSNKLNTAYRSSDTVVHDKEFNKVTINAFKGNQNENFDHRVHDKEFNKGTINAFQGARMRIQSSKENSEEEVAEIIAETMEQYMSKTRADYGLGIARPKIDDKDYFELKGQFLKVLRDNTFSGLDHEDANEHIEKVLQIVYLFHEVILFYNGLDVPTRQILDSKGAIPTKTAADAKVAIQEMAEYSQKWHNGTSRTRITETSDGLAAIQVQLNNFRREIKKVNEKVYAAQVGCEQCKGPHYTKDCPLKEEGKTLEKAYYTQFGSPFQQGGQYRAAALGFYQRNNVNPSSQEQR
ncbi:homeodomain-like protein [Tanacetum coccineum]